MAELSGDLVKLYVAQPYSAVGMYLRVARVDVEEVPIKGNLNNSLDPGYNKSMAVKAMLRVTWTDASFDPVENVYGGPVFFKGGQFCSIIVFCNGTQDSGNVYSSGLFLIDRTAHSFDANMLQPWSAGGESQGVYAIPGQGQVNTGGPGEGYSYIYQGVQQN